MNPFGGLDYKPILIESLGDDFYDRVEPVEFPQHILRFRNDNLLPILGLEPNLVTDDHFIDFLGKFTRKTPCLALRYHGYQFGQYNPYLGDGRGFLYGQVYGVDGKLYDFGTKGSGPTPHSLNRDGRLTLEAGIREVLAAEALHYLGVPTSRCLSLIETGESLWRDNSPTPSRSSVMVRLSHSHLRFGTFERLDYYDRHDLIKQLLDYVIQYYYPHLWGQPDQYIRFYGELVQRIAYLVALWMAIGFCHGVLNTDNMSITGESFDYGPYAFINNYNPYFTAASFDVLGRYSYRNQPSACRWNLAMLQRPLSKVISVADMEAVLDTFSDFYTQAYRQRMVKMLGFEFLEPFESEELLNQTLQFLFITKISYHRFFRELRTQFSPRWQEDANLIFSDLNFLSSAEQANALKRWKMFYYTLLSDLPVSEMDNIAQRLRQYNPPKVLLDYEIKAVWQSILNDNDWLPFTNLLRQIRCQT